MGGSELAIPKCDKVPRSARLDAALVFQWSEVGRRASGTFDHGAACPLRATAICNTLGSIFCSMQYSF